MLLCYHRGMIFGLDLLNIITGAGVIGIAIVIFSETGLLVGFFLPGDSLLVTAGLLTHQKALDINIHALVLIVFIAALLGNNTGYLFGRRIGRRLFERKDSLIFHKSNLQKAEGFYQKYGNGAVALACFVPFARTFVPILAGVSKMPHKAFLIFNTLGIFAWTAGITYLGFYAGGFLESRGINVDLYLLPFIGLVVLVSALPPLYHVFKDRQTRAHMKKTLKKRFSKKSK